MTAIIPITLKGDNLGQRHRYLNSLVNEAYKNNEDFEVIKNLPEQSPIDRLFKIDLASKLKNVDYIIKNLKDDDMLYVSKALKSKWLIEREEIINPIYLENKLYPEMLTTAITKMQHWVHLNLKDKTRCHQFYEYYYEKNFNLALKFVFNCSEQVIQEEFPKIVRKLTPHYFKVLCEKCPYVAKMFFDLISTDEKVKCQYLDREVEYFSAIRHAFNREPCTVLDIYEKYFNRDRFKCFGPKTSKQILNYHIYRYLTKPELYTAYILDMKMLAKFLSSRDAEDLVLKLAQAKYLNDNNWFSYKTVEPLIKAINPDERAEFKKKVFVTKDIGEIQEDWRYEPPKQPERDQSDYTTIFDDRQPQPYEYERLEHFGKKRMITKRRGCAGDYVEIYSCTKEVTLLDKLFNEFRFSSFGQTLYDLRKRIAAESSSQNRQYMMLVLVSKSGGRPDAIASLLELLAQHSNEPPHIKATIIRSLVKRAHIWRLPEESWNQLLDFGRGLGLDGTTPVADCDEGLHAVVIRSLLLTGTCDPNILNAFLSIFSDLTTYSLSGEEKNRIGELLPEILLTSAKSKENIADAEAMLEKVIYILDAYEINIETYPGLIEFVIQLTEKDKSEMSYLLNKLYDRRIARKQLFRYTFDLIRTDASYVNALKHDTTVLNAKNFVQYYVEHFMTITETFLNKLSLYFNEENGIASIFLNEIKLKGSLKMLGRPIAILSKREQLESYLHELDILKDKDSKALAASIRANAHITRPFIDLPVFGWQRAGAKFIANKLLKCSSIRIDDNIKELLKWTPKTRLALTLSKRTTYETEIFIKLAKARPVLAIKSGLKLMKLHGEETDPQIWDTIKPIIQGLDIKKDNRYYLERTLSRINEIPLKIRPVYSTVIYTLFKEASFYKAMSPLCHIEILLPDVDEDFIEKILLKYLKEDLTTEKYPKSNRDRKCACLYLRIVIKFLFLSKNEDVQKYRFETLGVLLLAQMEEINNLPEEKKLFSTLLDEILLTCKYSKVFLDPQYVSPMPILEKIVIWMQKLLPIEKHFATYCKLHLCMLYYKSVRQSVNAVPEVFSDELRTRKEGVNIVANLLGKHVAREICNLTAKFFDSITELYGEIICKYLEIFNCHSISTNFMSCLIKGILDESKGSEYRVGLYLISKKRSYLSDRHFKEIKEYVKGFGNSESQWFVCAETFV